MGLASNILSGLTKEPIILLFGIFVIFIIVVPLLTFFLDFWFALVIVIVIVVLGWLAVKTVFGDQDKVRRGRLNNVP